MCNVLWGRFVVFRTAKTQLPHQNLLSAVEQQSEAAQTISVDGDESRVDEHAVIVQRACYVSVTAKTRTHKG